MKRTILALRMILLAVSLSVIFCSCSGSSVNPVRNNNGVYCTVDGEAVTENEINYFKNRQRTDVINYYAENYGITDFSDFWNKEFDGVTPAEYLDDIALKSAVRAKKELLVMKEYGIYDDISFEGLKNLAEKYNNEHENAPGTVGITSIDMDSFYTYYLSDGRLEAINILSEKNPPSEAELAEFRENNKADGLSDNYVIGKIAESEYDALIERNVQRAVISFNG